MSFGANANITFCNLCFLSSFNVKTVLTRLDSVSLLMLFDCTPVESFRLGCTSVTVVRKSIPRTAQRSCTVLTNSRTLCNLSLWKIRKAYGLENSLETSDDWLMVKSKSSPFPFEGLGAEHEILPISSWIDQTHPLLDSPPGHWIQQFLHISSVFVIEHHQTLLSSHPSVSKVFLVQEL